MAEDSSISNPAPSPLEEADIAERVKAMFREARDHSAEWRRQAREDYAMDAGDQWDPDDRKYRKKIGRPTITFNRIGVVTSAVSGMEVNNRQEVRYLPRNEGDAGVNEMLTGAADWARDECDAEDEESDAFIDLLIPGMGWTETRLDYESDPDGKLLVERTDPIEMFWDPAARKRNLDDARYVIRRRQVDITDARAMFPGKLDEDLDAVWAQDAGGADGDKPIDREAARYYSGGTAETKLKGKVTIVEAQWWERKSVVRAIHPGTGKEERLTTAQYERISDLPNLKAVKQIKRVYKRAFVGNKLLEHGDAPCPTDFSYKCMTGKRDRNKGTFYGLVRAMKDPQKWANSLYSTILYLIATTGKGIIAEEDAFADVKQAELDWAQPDAIVWAAAGAISGQKIMPKPGGTLPANLPDMLIQAISAIRDVSGVNLEMLGLADREQAGVLESQRKQSAMTILAPYFDALRRYRKEQGRVMLYFITTYLSDGRLIRITGESGQQYVPLAKQPDTLKYDVIVDDAPSSPNQKEATWDMLKELLPFLMKLPLPLSVWTEIIKQSPFPESFAQKVTAALEQQAAQPQQSPEEMKLIADQQATQQKLQADQAMAEQKLAHDAQAKQQEMALKREEAQANLLMEQAKAEAQLQIEREKLELEKEKLAIQAQSEMQKFQLQSEAAEREFGLKAQTVAAEQDLSREKMNGEMAIKKDAAGQKAAVMGMDSKKGTLVDVTALEEGVAKGLTALGEEMQAFEQKQAEREDVIVGLLRELATPKDKRIQMTLPSGTPFEAVIAASGQINGSAGGRPISGVVREG